MIIICLLVLVFFGLLIILIYKLPDSPELPEDEELKPIDSANIETVLEFSAHDANRYFPFANQLVYLSQDQIILKNREKTFIRNRLILKDRSEYLMQIILLQVIEIPAK